ncbi:MAG TPA: hypothetical protein VFM93_13090 [Candidatus Limnocylindria bacterium]|nr:hypothetical protein [Candidatus Limnocylindria bacterium]
MKRVVVLTIAIWSLALGSVAAAGSGPTLGPEAGPGCFGKWRAGSVQWINDNGLGPAGLNYFADRAGDNSTINASNRATCAALE